MGGRGGGRGGGDGGGGWGGGDAKEPTEATWQEGYMTAASGR